MEKISDEVLIKKIAAAFQKIRLEKGLSQEAVINDTNIHMGRIEQGRFNLKIGTISALCHYFEIRLSDFFKMVENAS